MMNQTDQGSAHAQLLFSHLSSALAPIHSSSLKTGPQETFPTSTTAHQMFSSGGAYPLPPVAPSPVKATPARSMSARVGARGGPSAAERNCWQQKRRGSSGSPPLFFKDNPRWMEEAARSSEEGEATHLRTFFNRASLILSTFDQRREQKPRGSWKLPVVTSNEAGGAEPPAPDDNPTIKGFISSPQRPSRTAGCHAGWKRRQYQTLINVPAARDAGSHQHLKVGPELKEGLKDARPPAAAYFNVLHQEKSDAGGRADL